MSYFTRQVLNSIPTPFKAKFKNQQIINLRKITFNPGGNYIGINLCGHNLNGINLRGADLQGADLSNTDLSQACLSFANLSQANLQNSLLTNTKLIWTNLSHANLKGAKIIGAQMMSTNLTKSNLDRAFLWHVDLQNSILRGCRLRKAKTCQINLNGAELENSDLRHKTLDRKSLLKTSSNNIEIGSKILNIVYNFSNLEKGYNILTEEIFILENYFERYIYRTNINYQTYKEFIDIVTLELKRFRSEINQKKLDLEEIIISKSKIHVDENYDERLQDELIDIIEGINDIYKSIKAVNTAWKCLVQII